MIETPPTRIIGLISFIVPAWNEEAHLAATLTCIRAAARSLGERFEIVVANDGSTDRTGEIAQQLADRAVHVRHLAARLPHLSVIATDIYPRCFQLYRSLRLGNLARNFRFVKDNIFAPRLDVKPTAVVFFGACGAVSDGALDYVMASGAKYVMCRTCCHDNIGGNVTVTPRPNLMNRLFRFKDWAYDKVKKAPRYAGHYFSPRYAPSAYPRSDTGRQLSTTDEFMAVAKESADSDICRAIIDLDRCLHLAENGFRVECQGDLLVARREV